MLLDQLASRRIEEARIWPSTLAIATSFVVLGAPGGHQVCRPPPARSVRVAWRTAPRPPRRPRPRRPAPARLPRRARTDVHRLDAGERIGRSTVSSTISADQPERKRIREVEYLRIAETAQRRRLGTRQIVIRERHVDHFDMIAALLVIADGAAHQDADPACGRASASLASRSFAVSTSTARLMRGICGARAECGPSCRSRSWSFPGAVPASRCRWRRHPAHWADCSARW